MSFITRLLLGLTLLVSLSVLAAEKPRIVVLTSFDTRTAPTENLKKALTTMATDLREMAAMVRTDILPKAKIPLMHGGPKLSYKEYERRTTIPTTLDVKSMINSLENIATTLETKYLNLEFFSMMSIFTMRGDRMQTAFQIAQSLIYLRERILKNSELMGLDEAKMEPLKAKWRSVDNLLMTIFMKNMTDMRNKLHQEMVQQNGFIEERISYLLTPFKNDFELVIVHQADQQTLYNVLNDPRTFMLFWISHSNGGSTLDRGQIVDHLGRDLTSLFTKTNPNLKYLAVIGCEAKKIFDDYRSEGFLNRDLVVNSSEYKTILQLSLPRIMLESIEWLTKTYKFDKQYLIHFNDPSRQRLKLLSPISTQVRSEYVENARSLLISRTLKSGSSSLRIEIGGRVYGLLSREATDLRMQVPAAVLEKHEDILVHSSETAGSIAYQQKPFELGEIKIVNESDRTEYKLLGRRRANATSVIFTRND